MIKRVLIAAVAIVASLGFAHGGARTVVNGATDGGLIVDLKRNVTMVIKNGTGGVVLGMYDTIAYLNDNPQKKVIIDGDCASACTLLISDEVKRGNVCFTSRAAFIFHSTSQLYETLDADKKVVGYQRVIDQKMNQRMLGSFSPQIQQWMVSHNALGSHENLVRMDNYTASTLSNKRCK